MHGGSYNYSSLQEGGCPINIQQKGWATKNIIKFLVNSSGPPPAINNDQSLILKKKPFTVHHFWLDFR